MHKLPFQPKCRNRPCTEVWLDEDIKLYKKISIAANWWQITQSICGEVCFQIATCHCPLIDHTSSIIDLKATTAMHTWTFCFLWHLNCGSQSWKEGHQPKHLMVRQKKQSFWRSQQLPWILTCLAGEGSHSAMKKFREPECKNENDKSPRVSWKKKWILLFFVSYVVSWFLLDLILCFLSSLLVSTHQVYRSSCGKKMLGHFPTKHICRPNLIQWKTHQSRSP